MCPWGSIICLFVCFSLFCLCFSDGVVSIVLSSNSLILSSVSSICCSAHPLSFSLLVIIFVSCEIPIWLFFSSHFFAEAFCFAFITSVFVMVRWSIFSTAVLKSLVILSRCCHGTDIYWLSFFTQFEILVLDIMSDFPSKPEYFHIISWLWVLFKLSVKLLPGWSRSPGSPLNLCGHWRWWAPRLISTDTEIGMVLWLLDGG